ncbi:MAG: hypothetical protein K6E20_04055 [Acholeplasmatales bacterium]|nr:hypothetical protein [Acholeplasmatales bacterium]
MLKSVLKMVYITFGAVMCFIIYSLSYSTNVQNKIISTVGECVDSEDRLDVAKVFSMPKLPVDGKALYSQKMDGVGEVVIYNTVSEFSITTYENKGTEEKADWDSTTETYYENMYYMFIFNPEFTYTSGGDKNYSGIRFYMDDEKYLDYHFIISNEEGEDNYDEYIKHPQNKYEAVYNSKKNLIKNYSRYGLIFVPFTETLIEETTTKLGCEKISKVSIISNDINTNLAKVAGSIEMDFDFSQQFYTDVKPYVENKNIYENAENKDAKNSAKEFIDSFDITTINQDYVYGFSNSKFYSKSLVWNAIGIVALFIVVLILVYILIFHFAFIKGIIFRQPKPKQRYVPNKVGPKNDGRVDVNIKPEKQISSAHTKRKSEAIDAKVEPVKENDNKLEAKEENVDSNSKENDTDGKN